MERASARAGFGRLQGVEKMQRDKVGQAGAVYQRVSKEECKRGNGIEMPWLGQGFIDAKHLGLGSGDTGPASRSSLNAKNSWFHTEVEFYTPTRCCT